MFKQFISHNSQAEEIKYVEEVWSEKWQQKQFDEDLAYLKDNEYLKIIQKYLKPGSRLLEGGCGQGQWVRLFKGLGYAITGVDISQSAVEDFKKRYPDFDVRQGDVFHLDFPDNTFDGYLSFGVIEHFEDGPGPIIAEAFRVLKPGGYFCVSVPYMNSEKTKKLGGQSDNRAEFSSDAALRFYQYVMTKEELRFELEAKGFEVLRIYATDAGHTLKTKSSLASGIAASTKNKGGLFKLVRPILRKAWHLYVHTRKQEQHAHMIFAICRPKKQG